MYIGHFDFSHPLTWTIPDIMSPQACRALIERFEAQEWFGATVTGVNGRVVRGKLRDNTVALVEDPELADSLFELARPKLPEVLMGRALVGFKHKMRAYRYEVGQHFGLHTDRSYKGRGGSLSLLTFLLYLNDDFEGGETAFPEIDVLVTPRVGEALLFQHKVLHEGRRVISGTKVLLRTDVLYTAP